MELIIGKPDSYCQRQQDKLIPRVDDLGDGVTVTTYKDMEIDLGEEYWKAEIFVSRKDRAEVEPNSDDHPDVRRAYYGEDGIPKDQDVSAEEPSIDGGKFGIVEEQGGDQDVDFDVQQVK
jgi:hypothetical protein